MTNDEKIKIIDIIKNNNWNSPKNLWYDYENNKWIEKKANDVIKHLISVLHRTVGNKKYLNDLEKILEKLELSSYENETIRMLARDIDNLENTQKRKYW